MAGRKIAVRAPLTPGRSREGEGCSRPGDTSPRLSATIPTSSRSFASRSGFRGSGTSTYHFTSSGREWRTASLSNLLQRVDESVEVRGRHPGPSWLDFEA